jgi:hypothetical protein
VNERIVHGIWDFKEIKIPLETIKSHLPETRSHNFLQKGRYRVVGFIWLRRQAITKEILLTSRVVKRKMSLVSLDISFDLESAQKGAPPRVFVGSAGWGKSRPQVSPARYKVKPLAENAHSAVVQSSMMRNEG